MSPTIDRSNSPPGQQAGGLISSLEQFDGIHGGIDSGDCPNPRVPWMLGLNVFSHRAMLFRPRCKMWACPVCGPANAWVWAFRANDGAHSLYDQGKPLDFVAITSHEKLSPGQSFWVAPKAWMKLQARARRTTGGFDYFAVPEVQRNGRVHFHLITTAKLSKKWWKDNARECGFGFQSDKEEVWFLGGVIGYMSKYLVKSLAINDFPKGTRRVRTSRGWPKSPKRDPPDNWLFQALDRRTDLGKVIRAYETMDYHVEVKGSRSAWRYIDPAP